MWFFHVAGHGLVFLNIGLHPFFICHDQAVIVAVNRVVFKPFNSRLAILGTTTFTDNNPGIRNCTAILGQKQARQHYQEYKGGISPRHHSFNTMNL